MAPGSLKDHGCCIHVRCEGVCGQRTCDPRVERHSSALQDRDFISNLQYRSSVRGTPWMCSRNPAKREARYTLQGNARFRCTLALFRPAVYTCHVTFPPTALTSHALPPPSSHPSHHLIPSLVTHFRNDPIRSFSDISNDSPRHLRLANSLFPNRMTSSRSMMALASNQTRTTLSC